MRDETSAPHLREDLGKGATRGKLKSVPSDILVNVFVGIDSRASDSTKIPGETNRRGNLATACVKLSDLDSLAAQPGVSHIELGEPIDVPRPVIGASGATAPSRRVPPNPPGVSHRGGKDVLIGIIDVQGFDFAHEDFLDATGNTRFERIWDQGGNARPAPAGAPFNFGAEFLKVDLDAAIAAADSVGVPAQELERQSQMSTSSHGTHVASIAAGNRGVCPKARLAGVLISIPSADSDRRLSFYDSTRIAQAVEYLFEVGKELGCKAVSINISLGTNGHAHDASSSVSRWIDHALATPGRSICVAAGNAGQEAPEHANDIGFITGRIHTSGTIEAAGLTEDIELVVVGNTIADISENELEIWYEPQDRIAVSVLPPNASDWIGPIEPGEFMENRELGDSSFLSVYNELYHSANGSNYNGVYLSPFFSNLGVVGVTAGRWVVRLHAREIRDGRYHGWIERDDPRPVGRMANRDLWSFPSFFSVASNVDNSSISSLACGRNIVSVANLDEARNRINISSSQGPTRDGRPKPELADPGTDIVAANGFDPDEKWVGMTGTSMASPFVAGVIGLMLSVEPLLTAAQIRGIIQRTARPLPGADFQWRNDAGFGVIDPEACVVEAAAANQNEDLTE